MVVGLHLHASVPGYRLLSRLAAGGMAEVFLGERIAPGGAPELVVLKRVLPHLQDDQAMVGMLKDEIRLGLACHHPNVIATLDSFEQDGRLHAVLEYVEGLDLATVTRALRRGGAGFSRGDAVAICMELCRGLSHLHHLTHEGAPVDVVHRDVTPPNVLLGLRGEVKLCDFGFAKSKMQRTLTAPGLIKGKFSYLSPEAAHGHDVDARADVFAVGVLLWEMLTMERLFHAATDYETVLRVREAHVPALRSYLGELDDEGALQSIVTRALAREPDARFQSAEALYNALAAYADWQELRSNVGALTSRAAELRDAAPSLPPVPPVSRERPLPLRRG